MLASPAASAGCTTAAVSRPAAHSVASAHSACQPGAALWDTTAHIQTTTARSVALRRWRTWILSEDTYITKPSALYQSPRGAVKALVNAGCATNLWGRTEPLTLRDGAQKDGRLLRVSGSDLVSGETTIPRSPQWSLAF